MFLLFVDKGPVASGLGCVNWFFDDCNDVSDSDDDGDHGNNNDNELISSETDGDDPNSGNDSNNGDDFNFQLSDMGTIPDGKNCFALLL